MRQSNNQCFKRVHFILIKTTCKYSHVVVLTLTSFCLALTASQVDEVQFRSPDVFLTIITGVTAFQMYCEDRMATRRVGVHQRRTDGTIFPPAIHHSFAVGDVFAWMHRQPYDRTAKTLLQKHYT